MNELKQWDGYRKGINFGGWLSQCEYTDEHYRSFITEKDFATVRERGYDHIRVPVDYEIFEYDSGDFREEGFGYISFAIRMCRRYGLNMILDLHRTPGYSFDPHHNEKGLFESPELQEHFYRIWEEMARRFGSDADMLAFELLNEVTAQEYCGTWNAMSKNCFDIIRRYAPKINILIGGYWNNSVEAVKDLMPPYDENVIYNFHFYEPLVFTHQGAYWISTMDEEFRCPFDMTFRQYEELSKKYLCQAYAGFDRYDPDAFIGPDYFEALLREAIDVALERNVRLYCGEFGVIDRADRKEAAKWFRCFYSVLDKYSIGSALWNYKAMDFETDESVLKAE